uniref:Uncharacterized protein n=1 Tax=Chenopodium quinoa TaxID=63459 RepID=A0A803LZJ7_CHEQI
RSKVEFNVSNLEYLDYTDTYPRSYSIARLNALVEADIEVYDGDEIVLDLVCSMSNVQRFSVNGSIVYGLNLVDASELKSKLPVFRNLKRLKLGCFGLQDWNKLVMELLNCAPFLEKLTLTLGMSGLEKNSNSTSLFGVSFQKACNKGIRAFRMGTGIHQVFYEKLISVGGVGGCTLD